MKKAYQHSQVKLRDNQSIVIYFNNKRWSTGFKLTYPYQESSKDKEWSDKTRTLLKKWKGGDAKIANETIYKKKNEIDKLIDEARAKSVRIVPYVENQLYKKNEEILTELITKKTKPHEALKKFIDRKLQLKFFKDEDKSMERFNGYITNLKDFYEIKNKSNVGAINAKWVRELCGFLTTKREKTSVVYRAYDDVNYKTTRVVQLTNPTLKRLLSEINQMLVYMNNEHEGFNFPTSEISNLVNRLPSRSKYKQRNDGNAYDQLSWKQWSVLRNFRVSDSRRDTLNKTLDLYLFCCHTGLRYSDAVRLNDDYVSVDNVISMEAEKNRTRVVRGEFEVPMNIEARLIYEKYNRDFRDKFPKNQQINQNLKKVFKEVKEFHILKTKQTYVLMDVLTDKVPAHEILTFHSSRGHFVNMCVAKAEITILDLQRMTGWQDLRTLMSYMNPSFSNVDNMRAKLNKF